MYETGIKMIYKLALKLRVLIILFGYMTYALDEFILLLYHYHYQ